MLDSLIMSCEPPLTNKDKEWNYKEYYVGKRDEDRRKSGAARNHWSSSESIECYTGDMLRNTMHGVGEYRCRHRKAQTMDITYEGHFYNNWMHGYGVMSYSDGRVFDGLYHGNIRYGPGVETHSNLTQNVGLWEGTQLVRLTWRPPVPTVNPDILATLEGRIMVTPFRILYNHHLRKIGQDNSALDLLIKCGASPIDAAQKWIKLYPKNSTDQHSQFFQADVFDGAYFGTEYVTSLKEVFNELAADEKTQEGSVGEEGTVDSDTICAETDAALPDTQTFYAWNNNKRMMSIMKHSYQYEYQRCKTGIVLEDILNGPRHWFKPAAQHELDCRSFLMSSFLGHLKKVSKYITESKVHPNVMDIQGNSALMYATCGNQVEIIKFLNDAGSNVDDYNDACLTPLGAAMLNYAFLQCNLPYSMMLQSMLPGEDAAVVKSVPEKLRMVREWYIDRGLGNYPVRSVEVEADKHTVMEEVQKSTHEQALKGPIGAPGRTVHENGEKTSDVKGATETHRGTIITSNINEKYTDPKNIQHDNLANEFETKVIKMLAGDGRKVSAQYLFQIDDMVAQINNVTTQEKKKGKDTKDAKIHKEKEYKQKEIMKESKVEIPPNASRSYLYLSEEAKQEEKDKSLEIIKLLLSKGGDPRRVRCPHPALFIAIVAQDLELVQLLIDNKAKVNESYPQCYGYTALEIAISLPLSDFNEAIIKKLLENGAYPNNRLPILETSEPDEEIDAGPTLLHAVLAKETEDSEENDKRVKNLLQSLLQYGCDSTVQYKGRTPVDMAMSRDDELFDVIIESPKTDLNAVINKSDQTILVKMFDLEYCTTLTVEKRSQMLTNLLLNGADPLLKCKNKGQEYDNVFDYARSILSDIGNSEKPDAEGDFKQTLSLMVDCTRLLYIRWIQAELVKELIKIVAKYKHLNWNMILQKYNNGERMSLWVKPVRCLEICDVLGTTKKALYTDKKVRKYTLCIVLYYYKRSKKLIPKNVSINDKSKIESEIHSHIHEHRCITVLPNNIKRPLVMPELTPDRENGKYNVCFECLSSFSDKKIKCTLCGLVAFCSVSCLEANVRRDSCHPCSDFLKFRLLPKLKS